MAADYTIQEVDKVLVLLDRYGVTAQHKHMIRRHILQGLNFLHARITALEAENQKLRTQVTDTYRSHDQQAAMAAAPRMMEMPGSAGPLRL